MHRNRNAENGNGGWGAAGASASGVRSGRSASRRPAGAGQSLPATKDEGWPPGFVFPSPKGRLASEFLLATFGIPALALRGRLGNRVFKTYGDKIVITRVPRFDGYVPSAAQRDRRDRMRAATAFARAVYADPAAKTIYVAAARQLGRQPFRLAVADFLRGHARVTVAATTTREGQGGEVILKPESQEPNLGVSWLPDSRRVSRGGAEPRRRPIRYAAPSHKARRRKGRTCPIAFTGGRKGRGGSLRPQPKPTNDRINRICRMDSVLTKPWDGLVADESAIPAILFILSRNQVSKGWVGLKLSPAACTQEDVIFRLSTAAAGNPQTLCGLCDLL